MKQEFLHLSIFIQKDIYFTALFFVILGFIITSNVANAQVPIAFDNPYISSNIDEKHTLDEKIAPPPPAKTTQQIIIEQTTLLEDIRTLLIFLSLIVFFILLIIFTINLKIRKEK